MPITLTVNGAQYGGWKTARVERTLDTLSGAFTLSVSERWPDGTRPIRPFDACLLRLDADTVVTGHVDKVAVSYDDTTHTVEVTGRDTAGDLVDASAINSPGQWSGQRMETIAAQLLAPFGRTLTTQVPTGEPFKKFAIQQGESVHEAISRMAKMRAVLVVSDGLGNLVITRAGTSRAATALVEGQNILRANGANDASERFSEYIVKAQGSGDDFAGGKSTAQVKGRATDREVPRFRPLIVLAEGQANTAQAQERAEWERATRKAKGIQYTLTVAGWRQGNGQLWPLNSLVWVDSPMLALKDTMLITGVSYQLDDTAGSLTEITVTPPDAYKLIPEREQDNAS